MTKHSLPAKEPSLLGSLAVDTKPQTSHIKTMSKRFKSLIIPETTNENLFRRQYIFNILLAGSFVLATTAFTIAAIDLLVLGSNYRGASPLYLLIPPLTFAALFIIAKKCSYNIAASLFVLIFMLLGTYPLYNWSILLPQGLMIYALVIIISGILLGSRFANFMLLAIASVLLLLAYVHTNGIVQPKTYWASEAGNIGDAITFICTFGLIALVAWLSNRELEKSLLRARKSEKALIQERDLLETRVEERTRELQRLQLEKMLQLYRFAEIGRISSGLLHDMVNPLTVVSMNLEQLSTKEKSEMLKKAMQATKHLEKFVLAARKQMQNQTEIKWFLVGQEAKQVLNIYEHKAKSCGVALELKVEPNIKVFGNHIKFHQLLANLISNAIDAYEGAVETQVPRRVLTEVSGTNKTITVKVKDWGRGLTSAEEKKAFEPFFTTKSSEKGMGLGLVMAKNIVKNDFSGKITLTSAKGIGSEFTVSIPRRTDAEIRKIASSVA